MYCGCASRLLLIMNCPELPTLILNKGTRGKQLPEEWIEENCLALENVNLCLRTMAENLSKKKKKKKKGDASGGVIGI